MPRPINTDQLPRAYYQGVEFLPRRKHSGVLASLAAIVLGSFIGLAALGVSGDPLTACVFGTVAGLAVWLMEGWRQ
jgi:hypothetical protein